MDTGTIERIETVIVGGGQAGLATGYYLQRAGRPFVILDAHARLGDTWRQRWDSLHLFTPAKMSHLPGIRYPGPAWSFPSKDEFAAYLESYAERFDFDVRTGTQVDSVIQHGGGYLVIAGDRRFEADHVVIATGAYQQPSVPVFAPELDPTITQLHSSAYRNPDQLRDGDVLVVGGANSGSEIALELSASHRVHIAGRAPVFPVRPGSLASRVVMPAFFLAAMHVLTLRTPIGRRFYAKVKGHGAPVVRVKPGDLIAAGVSRVGHVTGVRDGRPVLQDGTILDVANVVWCTGFHPDYSWVDVPACATGGTPLQQRGVVTNEPGLYLVGQLFQYALASTFIAGVGRDAKFIAKVIARRAQEAEAARRHAGNGSVAARPSRSGRYRVRFLRRFAGGLRDYIRYRLAALA